MIQVPRKIYNELSYLSFILHGKKPWTRGYDVYRRNWILQGLAPGNFDPQRLTEGYGVRVDERVVEYPWLFSRLPEGRGTLLDAGSVLNYDFVVSHRLLESKRIFISTLAPEPYCFWWKTVSYVYEDLRQTCYRDDYFDWIVSLSTVEHIGMDNTVYYTGDVSKKENRPEDHLIAIREFHRILKPGGVLYLSFPFGKYKNHGWFQVFDGPRVDRLLEAFSPSSVNETHFRYEPRGWVASSREASKDATCFDIHQQKSYDEDFAAFSRAVVCLELIK